MIIFRKKPETTMPDPAATEIPATGAERIEEAHARRKKTDSDSAPRRKRQTVDGDKLL